MRRWFATTQKTNSLIIKKLGVLKRILQRPDHERPFLLLPVGYAANEAFVTDIHRKALA